MLSFGSCQVFFMTSAGQPAFKHDRRLGGRVDGERPAGFLIHDHDRSDRRHGASRQRFTSKKSWLFEKLPDSYRGLGVGKFHGHHVTECMRIVKFLRHFLERHGGSNQVGAAEIEQSAGCDDYSRRDLQEGEHHFSPENERGLGSAGRGIKSGQRTVQGLRRWPVSHRHTLKRGQGAGKEIIDTRRARRGVCSHAHECSFRRLAAAARDAGDPASNSRRCFRARWMSTPTASIEIFKAWAISW